MIPDIIASEVLNVLYIFAKSLYSDNIESKRFTVIIIINSYIVIVYCLTLSVYI